MNGSFQEFPSGKLIRILSERSKQSSALHRQFLQLRQNGLQNTKTLIELQLKSQALPGFRDTHSALRRVLFDGPQLEEFGTGKISNCLGPAFAVYDHRRMPRIPNGDLRMMSRITAVEGRLRDFNHPASITAEYDVPADGWFLQNGDPTNLPCSIVMEIALQPCGFLSAYLDTYALLPDGDFYFRNLDGTLNRVGAVDVRCKTIVTRAKLISSVVSGGTAIQKFSFELTCEGKTLYRGESVFGYFPAHVMANQVGLDGGQKVLPWLKTLPDRLAAGRMTAASRWMPSPGSRAGLSLTPGRMNFLEDVYVSPTGGRFGKGYVYAGQPVDPQAWYFPYHFYQDPVMPGSLGIEAVLEAVKIWALENHAAAGMRSPHFVTSAGEPAMTWRYRGQITRQNRLMELEFHLKEIKRGAGQITLLGDASLWVDGLRIYEVMNAAVGIQEG
ncbi:MAG: hypothetical protein GX491_21160 [Chloroflexi bacterium]|nr:hypothetical protein [Chloroflexota bacterium]